MARLTVVMGKAITRDINNGSFEKLNTPEKREEKTSNILHVKDIPE